MVIFQVIQSIKHYLYSWKMILKEIWSSSSSLQGVFAMNFNRFLIRTCMAIQHGLQSILHFLFCWQLIPYYIRSFPWFKQVFALILYKFLIKHLKWNLNDLASINLYWSFCIFFCLCPSSFFPSFLFSIQQCFLNQHILLWHLFTFFFLSRFIDVQ